MNSCLKSLYIQCEIHQDGYYQFLALMKDKYPQRLLCCECLYYDKTLNNYDKNIIPLTIALRSPEEMIIKLKLDCGTKLLQIVFQICEIDLEKDFSQMHFPLDKLQDYKDIQSQFRQWKAQILEKIQYTNFVYLLQELQNTQLSDQSQQALLKLSMIIEDMVRDDCALISNTINEVFSQRNLSKKFLDVSINELCEQFQHHEMFFKSFNSNSKVPLLNEVFQSTLSNKIESLSNKKIQTKNLIYLGVNEGLNITSFWDNVNGKQNLLMVFKTRNNFVFGGYSPCKWIQSLNNYVTDETLSSFLFSQTHNEIFPIKNEKKQYAILHYFGYSSGPVFGGGHDMYIDSDFKRGNSNLGHTYKWDNYQGQSSHHLFGEAKPNIKECEVYEIIFI